MQRRLNPAPWSPPLSGAGIQAFSKRKPGRKESQGFALDPDAFKTARWGSLHLLRLCLLQPSLSGSSTPDQIWKRIFGETIFNWILLCGKIQSEKISKKKVPKSGHVPASQSSAGRSRRNPFQSVFCTDMRRAKNTSQPESAGFAGAGRAASPKFGMGHPPGRQLDSLVRYPSERSPSLPGPSQISTLIPRASSQSPYGTASP